MVVVAKQEWRDVPMSISYAPRFSQEVSVVVQCVGVSLALSLAFQNVVLDGARTSLHIDDLGLRVY